MQDLQWHWFPGDVTGTVNSDFNVDDFIVSGLKFFLLNKGDMGAVSHDGIS